MFSSKYFMPKDFALEIENTAKTIKEIQYDDELDIYDNAILMMSRAWMHDCIFDENLEFVRAYSYWDDISLLPGSARIPKEPIDKTNIKQIPETVIYAGMIVGHFGHFITDCFTRLWYPIKHTNEKYKIVFTYFQYHDYEIRSFHHEIFRLLGIDEDRILIIYEATQFQKVIAPRQSVFWCSAYHRELLPLIYDTLVNNVAPKQCDKIYISKSKVNSKESGSFTLNENFFEEFFASQGFKIIYPEQMSVHDQIAYISGSNEIACIAGTLSHLAVFAKKDVKLICLIRSNLDLWNTFTRRQLIINSLRNINCIFVDISLNFIPLTFINNTHLIGPSSYWKDFIKSKYSIDINIDIFEYLDSASIKLGSYIREYVNKINDYKFGYVSYYLSMQRTFNSDEYNNTLEGKFSHGAFTRCSYKFKKDKADNYCVIWLKKDGSIITVKGKTYNEESYWLFYCGKLYFLNSSLQAIDEFITYPVKSGNMIKQRKYMGNSISNPADIYELVEIQHKFLKIVIKVLVNKKRYKKFINDPLNFFNDSKSRIIKFLGGYFI